ncbi:hypothetical protein BHAOGJBA_1279 [Methylobacterium hispanicum]|uniref:Uncharacterized protein n=1 Tax=Methylobacterium hispanicum TaxID=270350 RepID=A0AAV4ZI55_9HYPH|nr:hypothetical protein [Methylobacterium hispanicum]GJD87774.1 hypothetical protein BHAOGJBA_1279 [Methylobacterium hispanicum]
MTDEVDQHVKESADWARQAVREFASYGTVDRVAAAKAAVAVHHQASGFEGDLAIQVWQLLLSIDDLRFLDGQSWDEVFRNRDASAYPTAAHLVGGLAMLCADSGIDLDKQLHSILLDLEYLRPDREWPDLAPSWGARPAA